MEFSNRLLVISLITAACSVIVLHCKVVSSGSLIIQTAKKAFEEAAKRQRRDVTGFSLESQMKLNPNSDHIVEFDLILDNDQYDSLSEQGMFPFQSKNKRVKRKAVRHPIYHWPGAEVPYQIHYSVDSISRFARGRIKKAMAHWEQQSCIRFVEYDPLKHINSVSIRKGQWCASKLGMAGGTQPLFLALGCLDTGTIIHELGHTLGWVHEQARPDRDDYVTIKWDIITSSYKPQYVKHSTDFINTYNVPYDYESIMHYPSYGEIITKNPIAQHLIGQRNRLSFNDRKLANLMYKCAERARCDTSKIKCKNNGFIDGNCRCACPKGDYKSCTMISGIRNPYPEIIEKTTPKINVCNPWKSFDNAYISGYNDDVGFRLTIEQCKRRCELETKFVCQSFDYWKARRQCYLSSTSVSSRPGVAFSRDARMVHYQRQICPIDVVAESSAEIDNNNLPAKGISGSFTVSFKNGSGNSVNLVTTPAVSQCPFEYASIGGSCTRAIAFPIRASYMANIECKSKLGGSLWTFEEKYLTADSLEKTLQEGDELWINIDNYKSTSLLSSFFDFCPYLTKSGGKVILKDTFCYKRKGFYCQL